MKIQISPELEFKVALIPEIKNRLNNQPKAFYRNIPINNLILDTYWHESKEGYTYWAIVNYLIKGSVKLEGLESSTTPQQVFKKLENENLRLYKELKPLL